MFSRRHTLICRFTRKVMAIAIAAILIAPPDLSRGSDHEAYRTAKIAQIERIFTMVMTTTMITLNSEVWQ